MTTPARNGRIPVGWTTAGYVHDLRRKARIFAELNPPEAARLNAMAHELEGNPSGDRVVDAVTIHGGKPMRTTRSATALVLLALVGLGAASGCAFTGEMKKVAFDTVPKNAAWLRAKAEQLEGDRRPVMIVEAGFNPWLGFELAGQALGQAVTRITAFFAPPEGGVADGT